MNVKIISLNLWQGGALEAVCSFLEREKPDVVMLQEVYDGKDPSLAPRYRSLAELQKRLNFPVHDFEAALLDNRKEGKIPEGNAILSRFPILARDVVFFNEPFRDNYIDAIENNPVQPHVLQHVVLKTPAGEVNVYNLHGTWDLDGDNFSEKRRQMSDAIIAAVKDQTNVVLAGDTNAKPANPAMQAVEKYLASVFGTELPTTFNMRRKDNLGYATAAVDMMFISSNIRVVSKTCPNVDISDHLPLIVTLEIPEEVT